MGIEIPPELPPAAAIPTMFEPKYGSQITSYRTGNTYTFEHLLGEGFFSKVYACTDVWENELAIKILKPRMPVDLMRAAAQREFTTLLAVRHPNVTHTHDAFEYESNFFIVTERCLLTLEKLFTLDNFKGKDWLMPIARCMLQAVHSLHVMQIAHQDIHLGNVMSAIIKDEVDKESETWHFKLCDLGIARMVGELEATEMRKVSIRPPEVLDPSQFGPLDRRIDIYHTGLVLLQLAMSKQLEFTKEEILAGKPRNLARELDPPYSHAIEKALRRRVQYRTASAMELWRDLKSPAGSAPAG